MDQLDQLFTPWEKQEQERSRRKEEEEGRREAARQGAQKEK